MSSNMDKGRYWDEWSAYEAYMDGQGMDLDAIVESVLNDGKFTKNTPKKMPKSYDNFEDFWAEVEAFANQYRLPLHYVEEEFVIDGELIAVHLTFDEDPLA